MSDYDDYAEWQRQQANVKAGRSAENDGTFQEALKRPRQLVGNVSVKSV
jgi:hypothetical protein